MVILLVLQRDMLMGYFMEPEGSSLVSSDQRTI